MNHGVSRSTLVARIERLKGELARAEESLRWLDEKRAAAAAEPLSPRQRLVMHMHAAGARPSEIAERMRLDVRYVYTVMWQARRRLGISMAGRARPRRAA